MLPPVNVGRRHPVSLRGIGASKGGAAGAAASAMSAVAGRMAQTLTDEFGLAETDPRDRYTGGTATDAYGVEDMAGELSDALGGGPADRGNIARALHDFVREGAVLVAARPESRSLEKLQHAISGAITAPRGAGSDVDHAIAAIDSAVIQITGPGR